MHHHAFRASPAQAAFILAAGADFAPEARAGFDTGWCMPAAVWRSAAGFDLAYPDTDHLTLSFILSGAEVERLDGPFAGARSGPDAARFMLYPGYGERRYASRGAVRICQLYFRRSLIDALVDPEAQGAGVAEICDDRIFASDLELRLMTDAYLARALDETAPASALEMDARAVMIAAHIARRHVRDPDALPRSRPRGLDARRLAVVLEWIDAHLADDIAVRDLAAVAGLSPSWFATAFQRATGMSVHRHVQARRVERAKALLRSGASICEAAYAAGFASQQHLTTVFRAATGLPPGRWRDSLPG